ncbi:methyltransferase domain-containing protein [Pseudoroseicyclus tamaricis]|uniref:Class I SAM-dependent methyltransferase n=1 Tax=Pseudoroseicyclus tamaricis TaxID=2705421 RepID=A0A6B2K1J3_9RHOB|nr:class I SAM-dependent methyltransferase [Pseudoroseicyclus tamaricis]NDV02344.1 class I SAM-dependent methyltransferase [Pseudoroseicyclus tamaricis]
MSPPAPILVLAPPGGLGRLCDLACGTGRFLSHLAEAGTPPEAYLGLDISAAAIARAREAHPPARFPAARFEVRDLLAEPPRERFTHVVANGLFTVKDSLAHEEMWDFMVRMVTAMWGLAERGIAFNVMSDVVDWRRDDLFHVPTDRLLAFLYRLAGRRVVIRSDYGIYEYTAYVYREGPSARG